MLRLNNLIKIPHHRETSQWICFENQYHNQSPMYLRLRSWGQLRKSSFVVQLQKNCFSEQIFCRMFFEDATLVKVGSTTASK